LAAEGPLTGVLEQMPDQGVLVPELHGADVAGEKLFALVDLKS